MKRRLIPSGLLILFLLAGCSSETETAADRKKRTVRTDLSTPATLLKTLGEIIRTGREDILFKVYTEESVRAIRHNNKVGIGTAGTTDGLLREEIALHIARTAPAGTKPRPGTKPGRPIRKKPPAPPVRKKRAFTPPAIRDNRNGLLTVKWPSGNISPIRLVKRKNQWRVDVLNGPGGRILLLKD